MFFWCFQGVSKETGGMKWVNHGDILWKVAQLQFNIVKGSTEKNLLIYSFPQKSASWCRIIKNKLWFVSKV